MLLNRGLCRSNPGYPLSAAEAARNDDKRAGEQHNCRRHTGKHCAPNIGPQAAKKPMNGQALASDPEGAAPSYTSLCVKGVGYTHPNAVTQEH